MKFVLFDIDGTLANVEHRRHFVADGKSDWGNFFSAMGDDTPNRAVVDLYHLIDQSHDHECLIVTGRPEKYRSVTEQWLTSNEISFRRLIMRPHKDNRPDYIVKEAMLKSLLLEGAKIAFVVDDRRSVVEMWRRNGLTCFQCDDFVE